MKVRIILALVIALTALTFTVLAFSSCTDNNKQYNTDNIKKYVEKTKKENSWTPEEREKALKSIFPKMKID